MELGHLPEYGDRELISFDGLDRKLLVYATFIMFYGILTWTGTFFLVRIFRVKRIKKWKLILGALVLILNILIMFSPSFEWALD